MITVDSEEMDGMEAIGKGKHGVFSKSLKLELLNNILTIYELKSGNIELQTSIDEIAVAITNRTAFTNGILNISYDGKKYTVMWYDKKQDNAFQALYDAVHSCWYNDDTKLTYVASYNSVEEASSETNRAAKKGWIPQGTSATDGHINVGRTATGAVLTGGLTLLVGGSRSKGKVTITYTRTPGWLEEHKLGSCDAARAVEMPCNQGSLLSSAKASGQNDSIEQLERLAKLKEHGILTEDEFQVQKKKILGM
jgi:hypothetical protein